jgi:hypothetical protein
VIHAIAAIGAGELWRHNQAGDLPGDRFFLSASHCAELVAANAGKRGFTYTHHSPLGSAPYAVHNRQVIAAMNRGGFAVNLSGNNPAHADKLADTGSGPVVTVLPAEYERNKDSESLADYRARLAKLPDTTPAGRKIVVCPATFLDDKNCENCGLCAVIERAVIVGFPAHGASKRKADSVARGA